MKFKLITLTICSLIAIEISIGKAQELSSNDSAQANPFGDEKLNISTMTSPSWRIRNFDELPLRNIDVRFSYREARIARKKLEMALSLYPQIQFKFRLSESDILLPWEGQSEIQKFQVKCPSCQKTFRNSFYLRLHITRKHLLPERFINDTREIFWITQACEFVSCDVGKRDKHEISENGYRKHKLCLLFAKRFILNWKEIPETVSNFCIELVYAHKRADPPAEHVSIMKSLFYYFTIFLFVVCAILFYYYYLSIYLDSKLAANEKNK